VSGAEPFLSADGSEEMQALSEGRSLAGSRLAGGILRLDGRGAWSVAHSQTRPSRPEV